MKKTFILKYLLLMISLTFLYTTPAFASAGAIVGSVDVFNGTQISGWAYETASPLSRYSFENHEHRDRRNGK